MNKIFKSKVFNKVIQGIFVFLLYIVLLYPAMELFEIINGSEVRISAFIPITFGIIFGYPTAIAVFLANLIADLYMYKAITILQVIGSLINGLSAIIAYYAFRCLNKKHKSIHSSNSLLSYIAVTLGTELIVSLSISILFVYYNDANLATYFPIVFFNNVLFALLLGIPVLLYIPFCKVYDQDIDYRSLKNRYFRLNTAFSILISLTIIVYIGLKLNNYIDDKYILWNEIYRDSSFILTVCLASFAIFERILEKEVTNPLQNLGNKIRTDDSKKLNDIDLITDKIDFVAKDSSQIGNNVYDLFIGLTTYDGNSYTYEKAKDIINKICLEYVDGFTSTNKEGGYASDNKVYIENVLVYTVYGSCDEIINNITTKILQELKQDSILVEKNHLTRWYVYNKKQND